LQGILSEQREHEAESEEEAGRERPAQAAGREASVKFSREEKSVGLLAICGGIATALALWLIFEFVAWLIESLA
jgi:hypothetical protein